MKHGMIVIMIVIKGECEEHEMNEIRQKARDNYERSLQHP